MPNSNQDINPFVTDALFCAWARIEDQTEDKSERFALYACVAAVYHTPVALEANERA